MKVIVSIHHQRDPNAGAPADEMAAAAALAELGHRRSCTPSTTCLSHGLNAARWSRTRGYPSFLMRHGREFDVVDTGAGDAWVWSLLRRRDDPRLAIQSHGLEHAAHTALMKEVDAGRVILSRKYPIYHGGWRLREVGITLRRSDASFFLNQSDRDYAVARLGLSSSRAFVLHYGLSPEFLGLPPHHSRLLTTRSVSHRSVRIFTKRGPFGLQRPSTNSWLDILNSQPRSWARCAPARPYSPTLTKSIMIGYVSSRPLIFPTFPDSSMDTTSSSFRRCPRGSGEPYSKAWPAAWPLCRLPRPVRPSSW